jgi:transposase
MLRLRELSAEEVAEVERLARSRAESARLVERARIIRQAHAGLRVPEVARELKLGQDTVRTWIKRFNEKGLAGLADLPRSGCPPTYTPEQVAEVVAASLTDPEELGRPFGSWTIERLQVYLKEEKGLGMSRSRVGAVLFAEGLRWRSQETWFGERVDPEFAEKRGRSSACVPSPRRAV